MLRPFGAGCDGDAVAVAGVSAVIVVVVASDGVVSVTGVMEPVAAVFVTGT